MTDFINTIKKRILSEIDTLKSVEQSRQQASETVVLDQSSTGRLTRMDAMQQQAMAKENLRRSELRLKQLNSALIRIKNEQYGVCLDCDEDILPARLEANPASTLCIDCAEKKESSGN